MKNNLLFSQTTALSKTLGKRFVMVLTMLLIVGIGQAWGADATISSFTSTSGKFGDVSYNSYKGGGTSNPAVNSSAIRLYQNSNGNTGGYIVLSVPDGYTITSATIKSTMATTTGYYIDSNPGATTPAKANFEVSDKSLSANTAYTVSGLSTQYITFACFGTSSSSRLYVSYLSVTYQSAAAQTYNVTLSRNGVTETISDVKEGTALDAIDGTGDQGGCSPEWVFEGWSKTPRPAQNNTAVMDLVTTVDGAGPYYAVYSHTAEGGGGSTTVAMSSFSAVSGNVNNDANVSYEAAKGTAGTAPAVNDSQIRIYQNGGTLTITGNNEKKLTSITIGSAMATTVSYIVDSGTESSNKSISSNGKFTLNNIEASSVLFTCKGTDKNSRLYLNYLSVTYSGGNTVYYTTSPQCTTETSVTLNPDGGTISTGDWIQNGTKYTQTVETTDDFTLPTPVKEGYTFGGWYESSNFSGSAVTVIEAGTTGTKEFWAKWTAKQYTVQLDNQGATTAGATSVTTTYNAAMPSIANNLPKKTGYAFQGYFDAISGGTKYYKADGTSAKNWDKTSTATLYAQWECVTPTISTQPQSATYLRDDDADALFVVAAASDATLTYQWQKSTDNSTWSDITDATEETYKPSTQSVGTTYYQVVVTNSEGNCSATSEFATITVRSANCKWVETEIGDIESGDEVVIAMTKSGYTYALNSSKGTDTYPPATQVSIENLTITSDVPNEIIWNISGNATDGYVFYPNGSATTWLYCTGSNNTVKVGTGTAKTFYIENNYLKNTQKFTVSGVQVDAYVGVSISTSSWRHYPTTTGTSVIADQTLKFYKKECLPIGQYWINYDLTNVVCTDDPIKNKISTDDDAVELNFEATGEHNELPTTIIVTNGSTTLTVNTDYTWNNATGVLTLNQSQITDNITISIAAQKRNYTVTFDANGHGTAPAEQTITAEGIASEPTAPSATGYTFGGWYTDQACYDDKKFDFNTPITEDITLYAKWTAETYTITLNANGGKFVKDGNESATIEIQYVYGTYANYDQAKLISDYLAEEGIKLSREGYQLNEMWQSNGSAWKRVFTAIDRTIFAQWSKLYSITWLANGQEFHKQENAVEGTALDLPDSEPDACDDKVFVGWTDTQISGPTDDEPADLFTTKNINVEDAATTYYAVFATAGEGGGNGNYIKVTSEPTDWSGDYLIVANGNCFDGSRTTTIDASGNYQAVTISNNEIASSNTTDSYIVSISKSTNIGKYYIKTKSGYYIGSTATDANELLNSTIEKYDNTISISGNDVTIKGTNSIFRFYVQSGQTPRFRYYKGSTNTTLPHLYKKSSGTSYSDYTTTCDNTKATVTYDLNGGTGATCEQTTVTKDVPFNLCSDTPTKEGYTFAGWSDGTKTYAAGAEVTISESTTFYASWKANTYTVTWNNNGDTDEVTYNHGDALVVPAAPASCDGVKKFVGWTTHSGYYHATTAPDDIFTTKTTPVTATAIYYAVFATPPTTNGGGGGSETTTTLDFAAQGYANAAVISNLTVNGVTATFDKGNNSNAPKYYSTGTAIRAYGGNTITISYTGTITKVTFTFSTGDDGNEITTNNGDGEWNEPTWTGNTTSNIVFTIGGASGHRRIKSIAVTCTSGGGSGSYSDYTTICQQIESIEVQNPQTVFYLTDNFTIGEGKVIATLSGGGTADVTALATFSGYDMEKVGTYTVTVTYMGATATYNIEVKPLDNAWVLTWNVSGKTNTGLGPRSVTKGTAIGTLPTPEVPAACAGKTFMGWTESNIVPSDGVGIVYITEETKPTDNTTYYAVFATVNNFCTQKPIDQIDSGSKVVIVAVASLDAGGTTGKAISSRTSDDGNNLAGDEVSIYDKTINTPHSTCIWTLYKDGEQYYFKQGDYFLNAVDEEGYTNLKWNETKELWNITSVPTYLNTYYMESTHVPDTYIEWYIRRLCFKTYYDIENENGEFDMQFFVTANADGNADITDYTTGCTEYTITYYGFRGGYSTSTSSDGTIVLPVNSMHTVPNCGDVVKDHTNLGRKFLNVWMTKPHGGHTFKPGDTFILTQDTTLYAQWKMETTSDVTTLPTDIEDLAGTDVYVYGGKTLNIQPGTTTINSLTLKGGLQSDGSYKMPIVWVPEGATLVRNSNKIYLDLVVNAKNYYPFAVPFATKNDQYIDYLDPVLNAASTYGDHFVIKTYDGARRATQGEDRANNWVKVSRHQSAEKPSYLQPGVGYIITALTYPKKDTATIRIPMTVPNTWFENGEQAVVGTTVRNTIAVTAHGGAAATEHQRHAGWNFVASPYLTNFAGSNVGNDGGLQYINGELTVNGGWEYGGDNVPYVTIPAYDFSYYTQHKLSDVKLSPEWSFFVQIGKDGTMDFSTAGRQETPASIAARHDAAPSFKMDVDITLSDKNHSDQMGLIICDRFSSAYEVGYDLEKMFGSAYNLTVYTLMEDNTPLAYHALAIHSNMQVIPVGYRVPEQGEYTFALNQSTSSIDLLSEHYDQLILVDYETGALTNLLNSSYTFSSPRTQSNNRFAIYAVLRQNTPTDLPNIDDGDSSTRKILHNGHLYILRDGKVYNGNGQIVK